MSKRRSPTPAQLAERRHNNQVREHFFELQLDETIDETQLNRYIGKITFMTGTLMRVAPNAYCRSYRFSTSKYLPYPKIRDRLLPLLPPSTKLTRAGFYQVTHSIDVVFPFGVRVDTFVWRITNALEDLL